MVGAGERDEEESPASAGGIPTPTPPAPEMDPSRALGAWRTWLTALATDSEAALAAAMTYASLAGEARDAWLDALDRDRGSVDVPPRGALRAAARGRSERGPSRAHRERDGGAAGRRVRAERGSVYTR
jgi:hypothetical protein